MTTTRDRERLDAVEIGGDARLLVLDVTGPASITDAARQLGARDVLVNNAGISLDSKLPNSAVEGSLTRATEARHRGVRGRHLAGHALHVPTPVREYFLIGPEHTDSTQQ